MSNPFELGKTIWSPKGEMVFVNVTEPVYPPVKNAKQKEQLTDRDKKFGLELQVSKEVATEFVDRWKDTLKEAGIPMKPEKANIPSVQQVMERVLDADGNPELDEDGDVSKKPVEGKYKIVFDCKAYRFYKDGTKELRELKFYDAAGAIIPKASVPHIGNGSIGRVAFNPATYEADKRGVKVYLQGLQIIELSTSGAGGAIAAPPAEDGYVAGSEDAPPAAEADEAPTKEADKGSAVDLDDEIPF